MKLTLFFGKTATQFLASARPLALLAALLLAPWGRAAVQGQALPAFTYALPCGIPRATAGPLSVDITQNVQDAAGNSYLTGTFDNNATFGTITLQGNGQTAFIAKLDPAGNALWAVKVGGAFGRGIAVDAAGNVYVTGGFRGTAAFGPFSLTTRVSTNPFPASRINIFVTKLSPAGTFMWAARAGIDYGIGSGIAVDAAGCSYVCGSYSAGPSEPADFGPSRIVSTIGFDDVFATKLDPAGNFLWVNGGGSGESDTAYGIALDAAGGVYVTGIVRGIQATVARFGSVAVTLFGEEDVLVAKLSPAGVFQWATVAGGRVYDAGRRIAVDAQGIIHVVGFFMSGQGTFGATVLSHPNRGTMDAFVATLTPAGVWQWAVSGGSPGDDYGHDLAVDAAGNTYAVGSCSYRAVFGNTVLNTPGDFDVFVCKINPAGTYVWAMQAGGTDHDEAMGVALNAAGSLVLTGYTRSSLAIFGTQGFGGAPPALVGFVARLALGPLATAPARSISAFALWPNPARGGEVLHLSGLTTRQPIEVLDVLGRVVLTMPVLNPGTATITLPASLGAGVYLVRAGQQQLGRVIVQ